MYVPPRITNKSRLLFRTFFQLVCLICSRRVNDSYTDIFRHTQQDQTCWKLQGLNSWSLPAQHRRPCGTNPAGIPEWSFQLQHTKSNYACWNFSSWTRLQTGSEDVSQLVLVSLVVSTVDEFIISAWLWIHCRLVWDLCTKSFEEIKVFSSCFIRRIKRITSFTW